MKTHNLSALKQQDWRRSVLGFIKVYWLGHLLGDVYTQSVFLYNEYKRTNILECDVFLALKNL